MTTHLGGCTKWSEWSGLTLPSPFGDTYTNKFNTDIELIASELRLPVYSVETSQIQKF